jgi:hypothetical protein
LIERQIFRYVASLGGDEAQAARRPAANAELAATNASRDAQTIENATRLRT